MEKQEETLTLQVLFSSTNDSEWPQTWHIHPHESLQYLKNTLDRQVSILRGETSLKRNYVVI